jgi:hypothetical protein
MTENFPITPPPELVQQWMNEICDEGNAIDHFVSSGDRALAARAAQWGADQELEAYWQWADEAAWPGAGDELRAVRRPQSLKKQALREMDKLDEQWEVLPIELDSLDTIRKALEALPDD